jgi:hypothetical protein
LAGKGQQVDRLKDDFERKQKERLQKGRGFEADGRERFEEGACHFGPLKTATTNEVTALLVPTVHPEPN